MIDLINEKTRLWAEQFAKEIKDGIPKFRQEVISEIGRARALGFYFVDISVKNVMPSIYNPVFEELRQLGMSVKKSSISTMDFVSILWSEELFKVKSE